METLSKEFVRLGHEVTVVTLRIGDRPAEEWVDGIRVVRVASWSGRLRPLYRDATKPFHPTVPDPGAVAALRSVVRETRPDIVHSHSWLQYSYLPLHTTGAAHGHVVTLHDYGLGCAKKTYQHRAAPCTGPGLAKCVNCASREYGPVKGVMLSAGLRASRGLYRRADAYIAISSAVATAARAVLPARTDLCVVPSMVPDDMEELARTTPRPGFLPERDGYLLFVGALGPHKGLDVLLEAHRRLRRRVPLVLIGTPRADTPSTLGPDVIMARDIPSAQVMAAWRHASIGVVPSVWQEPLGQVAVEAMLAGRPVVASDVGGLRDVVSDPRTGVLVPPGDPGALATALDTLLADPALRARMGAEGRERAARFTVGAVTPGVLDVFDRVLRRRRARHSGT